jgi:hypothetical protein
MGCASSGATAIPFSSFNDHYSIQKQEKSNLLAGYTIRVGFSIWRTHGKLIIKPKIALLEG